MPKKLFIKGQSGNPKGKPKGVRHAATQISYALMEGNLEAVLATVIERAKSGDMAACRMIIDKVLPNTKDRPIALDLPSIAYYREKDHLLPFKKTAYCWSGSCDYLAKAVFWIRSVMSGNLPIAVCGAEDCKSL